MKSECTHALSWQSIDQCSCGLRMYWNWNAILTISTFTNTIPYGQSLAGWKLLLLMPHSRNAQFAKALREIILREVCTAVGEHWLGLY